MMNACNGINVSCSSSKRKRTSFSFAGCGFMSLYHLGVYMCIEEYGSEYFADTQSVMYGASAGSLLSVGAMSGIKAIEGYKLFKRVHKEDLVGKCCKVLGKLGAFHPGFDLLKYIRQLLEEQLPPDAHKLCRNRVGVSLTVLPSFTNWIVTDFNTRAELIQAVLCSCFVPGIQGFQVPPMFRGKMCCDGGFSNNVPYSCNPDVITVSPFSGECDICPNGETETHALSYVVGQAIQVSFENMYRGIGCLLVYPWNELEDVCSRGFCDAYNFLKREGVIPIFPTSTNNQNEDNGADNVILSTYHSVVNRQLSLSHNACDNTYIDDSCKSSDCVSPSARYPQSQPPMRKIA